MKKMMLILACILFVFTVYAEKEKAGKSDLPAEKSKYLWIDASANYSRFLKKEPIAFYLDKAKETGFNHLVVDVRPGVGDVLYKSCFLPALDSARGNTHKRDWDYLQYFIDEAKKRDMKISVSVTVFPVGEPESRTGVVYRSREWDGKTCIEYLSGNRMMDIRDDSSKVAVFLNPVFPEVREYCLKFIREIVENYDFDGFVLDYCRYPGPESDFSDASREAFEKYTGEKVEHFPEDIYTYEADGTGQYYRKFGKYGKEWFEFRAKIIHDFIKESRDLIKSIKPQVELAYWTGSWYPVLYLQGQNWASKKFDVSVEYSDWASPGYKNTGFADLLDVFMCGTYLTKVYGLDVPESIEAGLARAKEITMGDNTLVASIYAQNYEHIEDAAYVGLSQTEGLVVFDIIQVINYNLWDSLKRAIDKAEAQ
jgi:uncharacterized lipoprotein YddW (UPF0748 family)